MLRTVDHYYESKALEFPVRHPDGFSLVGLSVMCANCGEKAEDIRGVVRVFDKCIDVEAGGACAECRLVTWSKLRQYNSHFLCWRDEGIVTIHIRSRPLTRLRRWVKNLIWKGRK